VNQTTGGTSHWFVHIDNGTLEHGSSGSPLFNENKKVIGQLHSGNPGCNSDKRFWFGCFHRSWTGGGTNETRLSNWLDPTGTGAVTVNTSRSPTISGPDAVCPGSTVTFTVNNAPTGYVWGCSSNLFPISGSMGKFNVSSTPGTGWVSINYGDASITYNFSINTQSSIGGPLGLIGAGTTRYYATSNCGSVSYSWRLVRYGEDLSIVEQYFSPVNSYVDVTATYVAPAYPGQGKSYILEMWSGNTIVAYQGITVLNATLKLGPKLAGPEDIVLSAYPNPASTLLTIEITQKAIAETQSKQTINDVILLKTEPTYDIRLYNSHGHLLRHATSKGGSVQFDVSHLHNGTYYLHVYDGVSDKPEIRQIVLKH